MLSSLSVIQFIKWLKIKGEKFSLNFKLSLQFQDGKEVLLGSEERERSQREKPERDGSQGQRHPPRQRKRRFVSGQNQKPSAEMGSEALRHGQQYSQSHQGHCGRDEAHTEPKQAHDCPLHWYDKLCQ